MKILFGLVCSVGLSVSALCSQAMYERYDLVGDVDNCAFGKNILVNIPRYGHDSLIIKGTQVLMFPHLACSQFYDSNICDYESEAYGRATVYFSDDRASSKVDGLDFDLKSGAKCSYIPTDL